MLRKNAGIMLGLCPCCLATDAIIHLPQQVMGSDSFRCESCGQRWKRAEYVRGQMRKIGLLDRYQRVTAYRGGSAADLPLHYTAIRFAFRQCDPRLIFQVDRFLRTARDFFFRGCFTRKFLLSLTNENQIGVGTNHPGAIRIIDWQYEFHKALVTRKISGFRPGAVFRLQSSPEDLEWANVILIHALEDIEPGRVAEFLGSPRSSIDMTA